MQTTPIYDNSSERLTDNKVSSGVSEIIREHAYELGAELADVTNARKAKEKNTISQVVDNWARRSNAIGSITGFSSGQSVEETSKVYKESIFSKKLKLKDISKLNTPGELGNLKSFDVDKNNQFLDGVINVVEPESKVESEVLLDTMLLEAQILVDKFALENPITDNRFRADDSQFVITA